MSREPANRLRLTILNWRWWITLPWTLLLVVVLCVWFLGKTLTAIGYLMEKFSELWETHMHNLRTWVQQPILARAQALEDET